MSYEQQQQQYGGVSGDYIHANVPPMQYVHAPQSTSFPPQQQQQHHTYGGNNNAQPQQYDMITPQQVVPLQSNSTPYMDASQYQRAAASAAAYSGTVPPPSAASPSRHHGGVGGDATKNRSKATEAIQVGIRNLTYIVDVPPQAKGMPPEKRVLLNNISIQFKPGRLTVLMGASGAGKTTLMQTIAGDVTSGTVYGSIELNGEAVRHTVLQKASAFVYQDDCILQTASVLESINMSAELRLPKTTSPEERAKRVADTIKILNLTECQNTLIGSHVIRGVSGGERKRCAVGMELVTNPPILFIDEGTSGLDSKNALQLVRTLRDLARDGHTVITTMHQPSSEIFHLFDDLMILAKGELIFAGPAELAVDYFATLGFQCPRYTNPADYFFTSVINSEDDTVSLAERSAFLIDAWKTRGAAYMDAALAQANATHANSVPPIDGTAPAPPKPTIANMSTSSSLPSNSPAGLGGSGTGPLSEADFKVAFDRPGFGRQYALLFRRALRNQFRNRLLLRGKVMQTIMMSVIVGLVYLQLGLGQRSVQDRQGVLFFVAINLVMSSCMGVVSTFHGERPVFIREHGSGMYSLGAYFSAKVTTEFPILVIAPLIFSSILYWMVGFQADAGKFFIFYCVACLLGMCGNGIGFFVASIFTDPNHALQILPMFLLPLMLFSGYLINNASMPVYLFWLKYLSPMKYGLVALSKNEFDGLVFKCDLGEPCSYQTGEQVIQAMAFDVEQSIWQNIVILIALAVGFMSFACMALWKIGSKIGMAKYVPGPVPQEVLAKVASMAAEKEAKLAAQEKVSGALKV